MPSSRMIRSTTVALLLLLLFPVTSLVAAQIDNRVEGEGIFADQTIRFMYPNEPMPGASLRLRVRAFKNDLSAAEIRIWNGSEKTYAMHKIAEDEIFEYWEGTVPGTEVRDDLWYHFVLHDGTDTKWYNVDGVRNSQPYERDFPVHPGFRTPQWAKEATFYQIFVDRFYDGDPSNNVPDEAYALGQYKVYTHDDWNELPENPGHGNDFFGGDLAGVEAKLPYLQDLGVTAIYLNPIFLSPSNSKYDTRDYRIVDSPEEWGFGFGGDAAFDSLLHAAHNAGIRVILDGVFNHTGDWHQWFDRAGQYPTDGAFESKASEWSTFYTFFEWPYSFCHWSTFGMMPKLNYAEERVREEIYRNEDAIARYWPGERDTDGWRLDVPNEAGPYCEGGDHSIWREFRNAVKSVRPDAYITGEIWENATPWLEGDQFDAVMNYNGFAKPVWRFIAGRDKDNNPATLDVDAFDAWLSGVRGDNPPQATYAQQNLLDSHDTYRFLTLAGGDWRKVREAAILQMTYVGPPMIYYGDEVGMEGALDPDNRRTFPWNQTRWNRNLHDTYTKLGEIRRNYTALRTGSIMTLYRHNARQVYAYARFDETHRLVVAVNNSDRSQIVSIPVWPAGIGNGTRRLTDLLNGGTYAVTDGTVTLTLGAYDGAVLLDNVTGSVLPPWIDTGVEVVVSDPSIPANGRATTQIEVTPLDPAGNPLGSGQDVYMEATYGRLLDSVTETTPGTYAQRLRAPDSGGKGIVTIWVNGVKLDEEAVVTFRDPLDPGPGCGVVPPFLPLFPLLGMGLLLLLRGIVPILRR